MIVVPHDEPRGFGMIKCPKENPFGLDLEQWLPTIAYNGKNYQVNEYATLPNGDITAKVMDLETLECEELLLEVLKPPV